MEISIQDLEITTDIRGRGEETATLWLDADCALTNVENGEGDFNYSVDGATLFFVGNNGEETGQLEISIDEAEYIVGNLFDLIYEQYKLEA